MLQLNTPGHHCTLIHTPCRCVVKSHESSSFSQVHIVNGIELEGEASDCISDVLGIPLAFIVSMNYVSDNVTVAAVDKMEIFRF